MSRGGMQYESQSEEEITGINITPLVDVMLVLLVIFMVTTSYLDQSGIAIELPPANTGMVSEQGLMISIDRDGNRYYQQKMVSDAELVALLQDRSRQADGEQTGGGQISIAADQDAPHGKVIAVIDLLRSQGITVFSLQTANSQ